MTGFTPPPRALKRAKLDNLALVPASSLPYRDEYQAIANSQPPGTTLVVLPVVTHSPAVPFRKWQTSCGRRANPCGSSPAPLALV